MGTYNLPRSVKGEGRILYIFTPKSLIFALIGFGIGFIFYLVFKMMQIKIVGIILTAIFSLIGYAIGMMKVPNIGIIKATKVISGENLDEILARLSKFKKNKKIYLYDKKEEEKTNAK